MAALFVTDTPERLACLEAALAAGDRRAAREAVHGLAGSVGAIQARSALCLAGRLETLLTTGTMEAALPLLPRLKAELDRVAATLAAFLAGDTLTPPRAP